MTGQATTHPAAGTTGAPARPAPVHAEATGATAHPTAASYQQDFPGRADQLSQLRREITGYLGSCPATDDMVLIADELAANAIVHSRSRGATFTIRCQLSPRAARIEVEDMGGPWRPSQPDDRPHGLDIVRALTGPNQWGTQVTGTGGRIAWARLTW
jgi:anti-sigma regulatory factor (Ser/Thr protein kinase)